MSEQAPASAAEQVVEFKYNGPVAEYSETERGLGELRQRFQNVVFDVTTTPGMRDAIKARAELRTLRTSLEKKRVALKAPALERSRLIDSEAKRITSALSELEDPIHEAIKAEEGRKDREREEREERERQRMAGIQATIQAIGSRAAEMVGRPSADIRVALEAATALVIDDGFAEFKLQASETKGKLVATLEQLLAGAEAQEREEAERKAKAEEDRKELARLRAEQAERDRVAEVERVRVAAIREKIDEIKRTPTSALISESAEAMDRVADELHDREFSVESFGEFVAEAMEARSEAAAQLRRMAQGSRERAAREAEQAAERKRLADQKAEQDRVAAEQEAERNRQAEARRELERQQSELLDGGRMLDVFVERYGKRAEFRGVVKAIREYQAKAAGTAPYTGPTGHPPHCPASHGGECSGHNSFERVR